jgi:hypothetical protein
MSHNKLQKARAEKLISFDDIEFKVTVSNISTKPLVARMLSYLLSHL